MQKRLSFAASMMHALHGFLCVHLLTCLGLHTLGSEIIRGRKVPEKAMHYMASVQNKAGQHVCGGFLINEDFVVTAAHCVVAKPASVVLGTHNLKKADATMRYNVKMCKHPSYVRVSEGSDIMLLKLSRKAPLSRRLQPVNLPETKIKIKDEQQCRVAGWGLTSDGELVDELQMVDVPVVNLEVCKKQWGKLAPGVICAGGYGTNKGFCQGDSGGPLVCNGNAVGVVSYNKSKNCNYPDVPNVYTNISKYLRWITSILSKKNC